MIFWCTYVERKIYLGEKLSSANLFQCVQFNNVGKSAIKIMLKFCFLYSMPYQIITVCKNLIFCMYSMQLDDKYILNNINKV